MPFLATLGSGSFNSYRGVRGIARRIISLVLDSNTTAYDVYTNRGPSYVAGLSDITVTVNPGVLVSSFLGPGNYSLLVPSAFDPNDTVTIINNGSIIGSGGTGGAGGSIQNGPAVNFFTEATAGIGGGDGVYVNRPTVITNNGTIAGGGGGGGGGGYAFAFDQPAPGKGAVSYYGGGGGGGGGVGGQGNSGGAGGTYTAVPPLYPRTAQRAGPGSGGTNGSLALNTAGVGGARYAGPAPGIPGLGGDGGNGGTMGSSGSAGQAGQFPGSTYTPFPAPWKTPGSPGAGGAAGFYIVGNPFVTWPATGTRLGSVG